MSVEFQGQMSERQERIMDATGASNWADVITEYAQHGIPFIQESLDMMFPADDNSQLAADIYAELND